jgi:hypothetical protein
VSERVRQENNILNGKPQSNMFFTQHSFPLIENHSLASSFVCLSRAAFVWHRVDEQKKKEFPSMAIRETNITSKTMQTRVGLL